MKIISKLVISAGDTFQGTQHLCTGCSFVQGMFTGRAVRNGGPGKTGLIRQTEVLRGRASFECELWPQNCSEYRNYFTSLTLQLPAAVVILFCRVAVCVCVCV